MKTAYLFIYNLLQFIMYTYVSILLFTWFILYGKGNSFCRFVVFYILYSLLRAPWFLEGLLITVKFILQT